MKNILLIFAICLISLPVQARITKRYGVDVNLLKFGDKVTVFIVNNNSSAYDLLKTNDEIISINGVKVKNKELYEIKNMLSGNEGSIVKICVLRNKKDKLTFSLTRKEYNENGYLELFPGKVYLHKETLRKDNDNVYFWTKLMVSDDQKKLINEDLSYFSELSRLDCKNNKIYREDLLMYDNYNRLLSPPPKDEIYSVQNISPESSWYPFKQLFCLPEIKNNSVILD